MTNKTTTKFVSKEEVAKVPGLWLFANAEGIKFSSFHPDNYPLGEELDIAYEAVNTGKFVQNRLIDKPATPGMAKKLQEGADAMKSQTQPRKWFPPSVVEEGKQFPDLDSQEIKRKLTEILAIVKYIQENLNPPS